MRILFGILMVAGANSCNGAPPKDKLQLPSALATRSFTIWLKPNVYNPTYPGLKARAINGARVTSRIE